MPNFATLATFVLASLVLAITPGPALVYTIATSIRQNRTAGIMASLGAGVGIMTHTLIVAFGLSALLLTVPFAFEVIKIAGAVYLIYLGVRAIISKDTADSAASVRKRPLLQVFGEGVLASVINPKAALFFLAFLPQFVDQSKGNVFWQIIILGIINTLILTAFSMLVALLSSYLTTWMKGRRKMAQVQSWLTGGIFVVFGIQLLFTERKA